MLASDQTEFIMEAHNGLSARIVEEAGFKGVWASGLSISASLGVRDNNEASWTQVTDVAQFMADATSLPILLDGDTGFGNFNNARILVSKLEKIGVAGVCMEDKLFPKTNSFLKGESQELADIDEFCGKIAACKAAQTDPDFSVIARLESFITGTLCDRCTFACRARCTRPMVLYARAWARRRTRPRLRILCCRYRRVPS
jgi:phosphoenolpyruvate phosphomutase